MSRIVQLRGTCENRHLIAESIAKGLYPLASVNNSRFLTKKGWYPDRAMADVIMIYGLSRVFDPQPGEKRDEFGTDKYWSSDYIVVLEKPDTTLYNVSSKVSTYPAESGMAHGMVAMWAVGAGFLVTLAIAFAAKQGMWSFAWAIGVATLIILGYAFEYRTKVSYATVIGWWYVRNAIKSGHGTRQHYMELVRHLSTCDDPVVADVNRMILRFL